MSQLSLVTTSALVLTMLHLTQNCTGTTNILGARSDLPDRVVKTRTVNERNQVIIHYSQYAAKFVNLAASLVLYLTSVGRHVGSFAAS